MTSDRRSPIVKEQEKTTGRRRARAAQAAVFRLVNVPRRVLLGLPSSTPMAKRLMLVHHIGPVTGKRYRQPVSYVPDGDTLLTPGGGRWTRNLRDGEPTRIRLRGKDDAVRPDLIADPAEIERLLGIMAIANPAGTPVRRDKDPIVITAIRAPPYMQMGSATTAGSDDRCGSLIQIAAYQ
jgi:hypothetical protein